MEPNVNMESDLAARDEVEVVLVRRATRSRTKGLLASGNLPTTRLWPGSGALSTNTCQVRTHQQNGMFSTQAICTSRKEQS